MKSQIRRQNGMFVGTVTNNGQTVFETMECPTVELATNLVTKFIKNHSPSTASINVRAVMTSARPQVKLQPKCCGNT